jgi:AraC family transcriptional regulator
MRTINFTNPRHHSSLFAAPSVRSSAGLGWSDLYFERREDDLFETSEHALEGHYLMVKLNPWSMAERRIDGRAHMEIQRRGATAYVPPGCHHAVRYVRPLGSLCFMTVSSARVREVAAEMGRPAFSGHERFAVEPDPALLSAAECIDRELAAGNPNGELFAQTYSRLLAAHLVMGYGEPARSRPAAPGAGPRQTLCASRMKWLDDYIEANLSQRITLEDLATQAGLSPFYFTRIFKATSGFAPYQYVLHKRIEFARRCLHGDNSSVEEIAFAAGFGDAAQFARHFRKICGETPSAYRRSARRPIQLAGIRRDATA